MGDATKRLSPGDRWTPTAEAINSWQDAADYVRNRLSGGGAAQGRIGGLSQTIVMVKNNSDADRRRFDVLGISSPVFTPTDNAEIFCERVVLSGEKPSLTQHLGRFVVLLQPLPRYAIGPAVIGGVVPVRLRIVAPTSYPLEGQTWYPAADVEDNQAGRLISRPYGAAQILWKESGEGDELWALVRLGPPAGLEWFLGTLQSQLVPNSYANAEFTYQSSARTQRVYEKILGTYDTAISSGTRIIAMYKPDEQKFILTQAACPSL